MLELERRARDLHVEWDRTFRTYWNDYDAHTRRVCFCLALEPAGQSQQELESGLDGRPTQVIDKLQLTGVLFKGQDDKLRLIELFRTWYENETGFAPKALTITQPVPLPQPEITDRIPEPESKPEPVLTTELTFLPKKEVVLIKRGRFLWRESFSLTERRLDILRGKVRRAPAEDGNNFWDKLVELSSDLWIELKNEPWFDEIRYSAERHYRLRFNIPVDMGEFPFELIPLDDTGTQRIGLRAAISRQLVQEGRYVNREPLELPGTHGQPLNVLVIAAEVGGKIAIGADGDLATGPQAEIRGGSTYELKPLSLGKEVAELHRILTNAPTHIGSVTFLHNTDQRLSTNAATGVTVVQQQPTIAAFNELLKGASKQFDIVHFAGHGLMGSNPNDPNSRGLLFTDKLLHLSALEALLQQQTQLRFVYLSCCESGQLSTGQRSSDLLGLAHTCVQAGVPAALGMRWRINVKTSAELSQAFYQAFLQKRQLDMAVFQAINHVHSQAHTAQQKAYAAAPVLLMH